MGPLRALSGIRFGSIGSKILVRTIVVVLLPLLALSAIVLIGLNGLVNTAEEQVDESRDVLSRETISVTAQDQALSVAREINATLLERVEDVASWARNPVIVDGAKDANTFAQESELIGTPIETLEANFSAKPSTDAAPIAESFLNAEVEAQSDFGEVFFTDANGFNAAFTKQTSDFVQSDEDWWQTAWDDGISTSDVEFDDSSGLFLVDVAVRIDDPDSGRQLGVIKAGVNVRFIQSIATARSIGSTEYTVALPNGLLIAETESFNNSSRMMVELPAEEISAGLLEAQATDQNGALITDETVFGFVRTTNANLLGREVLGFKGFDWIVVSSQRADVAFSPLRGLENVQDEIGNERSSLQGTVLIALLIAVVIAAIMARLLSRNIVGPIRKLTGAASDAATTTLPTAVEQIEADGGELESVEVPELQLDTGDELERLANSFNSVQGTAIRLASEQAMNRRNTADMFVNLGRRNNSLLKRQLRFIDNLERNEADPDTLESLFKLDHLATRMRRNAESLLVLAGERSPRRWSAPVHMRDAVQSALAEVEEYERTEISGIGDGSLQGNVVADVAHILAELIENALTFSPPQTDVAVRGRKHRNGYTIIIVDQGIGMGEDELAAANRRLSTAFELSQVPAQHIGLFVVGRLANQHDISVALADGPNGGTVATIELPTAITGDASALPEPSQEPEIVAAIEPEATEPEATESEATEPEATEPEATEPEATEPDAADAEAMHEQASAEEAEARAMLREAEEKLAAIEAAKQADESEADAAAEVSPDEHTDESENTDPAKSTGRSENTDQGSESQSVGAPITPNRRATDPPDSGGPDDRRGPDDPPSESVTISGIEIPRRRSAKPGTEPMGAHPSMQGSADTADGNGVSDANRQVPSDRVGPNDDDPALSEYGFTRRRSRSEPEAETSATVGMVAKTSANASADEVEATASASKNQWSSFQRAKEAAESVAEEADES